MLTCAEVKWEKVARGDSVGKDWSKTPNSLSKSSLKSLPKSTTYITLVVSSSRTRFEEVSSSLESCLIGSSTT